eukprot:TRINITY_DN4736_c0_g2_i1.p1 TRINITY_DN4736_c0_g2~~TRINITY_DN4736_c0_g2_i1.p1  ORF type:complete len:141 (-),score=24.21 TRINITY_DN4736_c0_g2_i1:95-517(-)
MLRVARALSSSSPGIKLINVRGGPPPVGPYSPAVAVDSSLNTVFLSGSIPTNCTPDTPLAEQAMQVFENIDAVLRAAGCKRTEVVKCTVLLTDMADFVELNVIYEKFFAPHKPARSCFAVKALPKGARLEIEAIAVTPKT